MKKLNTNNAGRMPLWQADLDWMQQSYTEIIHDLVKELANTGAYMFPVSGCKVTVNETNNTVAMTGGWFWWDGELLPVRPLPATSSIGLTVPAVHLTRVSYTPEAGARNFIGPDLAPVAVTDTWQDDYLQPEACERNASFDSGVTLLPGAWTIYDRIQLANASVETDWTQISGLAEPQSLSYKRIGRTIVIRGCVFLRNNATPAATGLPAPLGGTAYLGPCQKGYFIPQYHPVPQILPLDGELYAYVDGNGGLVVQQIDFDANESSRLVYLSGLTYIAADAYAPALVDMNVIVHE